MTIELNTISTKKFVANYGGITPTIDSSNGVRVGDFAIDSSTTPNKIWRCLVNTIGSPIWVIDQFNVVSITNTYTVTSSDNVVLANSSSTAFSVNLPAASASSNLHVFIKKVDSSSNAVTFDANASELIDGELTQPISNQYDCIEMVCYSGAWYIV